MNKPKPQKRYTSSLREQYAQQLKALELALFTNKGGKPTKQKILEGLVVLARNDDGTMKKLGKILVKID